MNKKINDIAIIGLSCKFPEATDQFEYWERIRESVNCVGTIPEERWDWQEYWGDPKEKNNKTNSRWGGFIKDADAFDNDFFGLIPRVVEAMDPQQRIMLELTWKCLEDAGIPPSSIRGKSIGLIFSAFNHDYKEIQERGATSTIEAHSSTGNATSIIANRVSHYFDLKGPSLLIDTACSGSLNAIHCATQALEHGDCDMAFAGGVNLIFTPTRHISFSKMGMMSPTGTCRSFDKDANGYVRGEGAGVLLLKPLAKALEDKDTIYGVIKGTAVNHCGETYTMTYPSPEAQANVIIDAHRRAGVTIDTISYVEAHGTGTPKGDPIEFQGLERAFMQLAQEQGVNLENNFCGIGSVKSNVGHLESAAGIAGIIKVLMQLRNRQLPAVQHFNSINPKIAIDESPFFIVDKTKPWKASSPGKSSSRRRSLPLRAGVSSFGFGGTNAHVVLEEAPRTGARSAAKKSSEAPLPLYPIPLSAKTDAVLRQKIVDLREWLANPQIGEHANAELRDISFTLATGRDHFTNRAVYVSATKEDLLEQLQKFDEDEEAAKQQAALPDVGTKGAKKLLEMSNLYLSGEYTDWSSFYSRGQAKKLRLPTYPFVKNRFWLADEAVQNATTAQIHPLIHKNVSDFECQSFESTFSGNEFFLKDHQVHGESVLPGSAYIEMVTQAIIESTNTTLDERSLVLENIAWLRPIRKGSLSNISITLFPLELGTDRTRSNGEAPSLFTIEFEVSSNSDNDDFVVHCHGQVSLVEKTTDITSQNSKLDFTNQCSQVLNMEQAAGCNGEHFYKLMSASGLKYGQSHACITSLHLGDRDAVAYVCLPDKLKQSDRATYVAHPSLLDSAIQAAVALVWSNQSINRSEQTALFTDTDVVQHIQAQLPFLLQKALINGALGDSLCVYLKSTSAVGEKLHRFDIVVANVDDEQNVQSICLKLEGLTLRALPAAVASESDTQPVEQAQVDVINPGRAFDNDLTPENSEGYYTPQWVEHTAVTDSDISSQAEAVVLFVGLDKQDGSFNPVIETLETTGAKVVQLLLSDEFASINENRVAKIRSANEDDVLQFVAELKSRKLSPTFLVHKPATGADAQEQLSLEVFNSAVDNGIKSIFLLVKSLIKQSKKLRLITLVEGKVFTQPVFLGLSGFYKAMALEKPTFNGRVVQHELTDKNQINSLLLNELYDSEKHSDIAYVAGKRYVRYFDDCRSSLTSELTHHNLLELTEEKLLSNAQFTRQGAYVITGGMGALGLIFARYLMQEYEANVYLTGRGKLNDDKQNLLDELNQLSGKAEYVQCDVNDFDSVKSSIEYIREQDKRVDGILHSAGVIEDNFILKKPYSSLVNVITPKSQGTIHLDLATANDELSSFLLFSSVTGVLGNLGQCDYAYGNSFEDYFSLHRNMLVSSGLRKGRSVAINWPYWRNGGMLLTDKEEEILNKNFGIVPLETQNGIEAVEKALQLPLAQLAVLPGNAEKVRQVLGCLPNKTADINNTVGLADTSSLNGIATDYLIDLFSKELKVPKENFTLDGSFNEFGFDSVVMLEMIDLMEKRFSGLPKTLFFECQSIADLGYYLVENYSEELSPKPAASSTPEVENKPSVASTVETTTNNKRLARSSLYGNNSSSARPADNRIAIVGLSGRYPDADSADEFWDNLANGRDCIREIPEERWDIDRFFESGDPKKGKSYSKWGGFLKNVDKFDALFFNISPKEAVKLDPQERLFLEVVSHAIEDAGYHPDNLIKGSGNNEKPVGVYTGVMWGEYQLFGIESGNPDDWETPRSFYWSIANRVSYFFNFTGPSITLDTACSSSLTAIHLACKAITSGEVSVAIAGGVNLSLHPQKYHVLSDMQFLSSDGRCRSFGDGGTGYVPGECVGAVVLKPLAQAERDGDHIYGVIKGTTVNHGGKVSGFTVPNPARQAALVKDAMEEAQVNPRHISYVEAHGTGTSLGDPLEVSGLTKAFAQSDNQYCAIGSAKSNIGHAEAAAGIAGLTKVLMQMKHKTIAPSLHSGTLNPNIEFENTPFKVNQKLRPWERPVIVDESGIDMEIPRIAGLSSFGAGGSNGHVIIEEYIPKPATKSSLASSVIVPVSAKSKQALLDGVDNLIEFLEKNPNQDLTSFAYTLQTGRVEFSWRLTVIAKDQTQLIERLSSFKKTTEASAGVFYNDAATKGTRDSEKIRPPSIAAELDDASMSDIASKWISGKSVSWEHLYGEHKPVKLPLPGYAFQRRRYWIDTTVSANDVAGLHPVLQRNISTLEKTAYKNTFRATDFFIKSHKINGNGVLPGVVYLEMAYQAIANAMPDCLLESIYDIEWLRPVVVNSDSSDSTFVIEIIEDQYGFTFEVCKESGSSFEAYCRGGFGVIPDTILDDTERLARIQGSMDPAGLKNKVFDIAELKSIGKIVPVSELNNTFEQMGFNFGEAFKPFTHINGNSEEAFAHLELSEQVEVSSREFILNPVLLDGALRTSIAIGSDERQPGVTPLPVKLSRLQIVKPLTKAVYVLAQKKAGDHEIPGRDIFAIYLLDNDGSVLAHLEGFETQKVSGFLANHKSATPIAGVEAVKPQAPVVSPEPAGKFKTNPIPEYVLAEASLTYIKELIAEQTGISVTEIDEFNSIESYGIESLMIHAINENLNKTFGEDVSKTLFYEYESIAEVSNYLADSFPGTFAGFVKNLPSVQNSDIQQSDSQLEAQPATEVEPAITGESDKLIVNFLVTRISEVTELPVSDISLTETFDNYGIDSLMINTLNERIGLVFGEEVSKTLFYEFDDIVSLAQHLAENHSQGIKNLVGQDALPETVVDTEIVVEQPVLESDDAIQENSPADYGIQEKLTEYLSNFATSVLGRKLSSSDFEQEAFFLDDIEQIKLSYQLRTDLDINIDSSVLLQRDVRELVANLIETQHVESNLLEKLNKKQTAFDSTSKKLKPGKGEASSQTSRQQTKGTHSMRKLLAGLLDAKTSGKVSQSQQQTVDDIAIIGLSGRYPLADNLQQFWSNLLEGRDCIREVPEQRWDHSLYFNPERSAKGFVYSKWGGFMDGVDMFDAEFFKMTRREAEIVDPQERELLKTAWQCLEDAAYTKSSLADSSVGVFIGVMWGDYQLIDVSDKQKQFGRPAASFSSIPNRVSYFFDFHGPSMAMDTMCSSSLSAIHTACQSIRSGDCEYAIAGGVNISAHVNKYQLLCQQQFLSEDGRCRTFGAGGTGYVPGEGVGAVMLKPLQQAEADGDNIYAVIRGSALNHGGKTSGFTVPNQREQSNVISKAYERSGWTTDSVQYVEAHGTGTSLGDPIEVSGLTKVFSGDQSENPDKICYLGSVKSNIGHLESAAGIAGLTKVLLQMKHGTIAPSLHSVELNPNLLMNKNRFEVPQKAHAWNRRLAPDGLEQPRRAGISAFGAGGSNSHLLIEEYIAEQFQVEQKEYLFLLSADSLERLRLYAREFVSFLKNQDHENAKAAHQLLCNISYTSIVGREHRKSRLAILCSSLEQLSERLESYLDNTRIKGLFQGADEGANIGLGELVDRETKDILLASLFKPGRIQELAKAWVSLLDIDWKGNSSKLFPTGKPARVSMPSQPLLLERHWVDVAKTGDAASTVNKIHPLLHSNISTIQQQAFKSTLSGNEFFLKDHLVENDGPQKILPGVAYLELARAAAQASVPAEYSVHTIRDVVWFAPIKLGQNAEHIKTLLSSKGNGLEYHVIDLNNDSKLYSSGEIDFTVESTDRPEQWLDVNAINSQTGLRELHTEIYQQFHDMGFYYGPSFRVTDWRLRLGDSVLAKLSLPQNLASEDSEFVLHPSLMDGALRTCLAVGSDQHTTPMVPFSLGEIEILAPLEPECYVYASSVNNVDEQGIQSDTKQYNLVITDLTGRVLVKVRDISARNFDVNKNTDSRKYYTYDWKNVETDKSERTSITGFLGFVEDEDLIPHFSQMCPVEKQVWVTPGETFAHEVGGVYTIRLHSAEDYYRLFETLVSAGFELSHIVNLMGTKRTADTDTSANRMDAHISDELEHSLEFCYHLLRNVSEHYLSSAVCTLDIELLQNQQRNPFRAGMAGFAKSMVSINHKFEMCSLSVPESEIPHLVQHCAYIFGLKRNNGKEFTFTQSDSTLRERVLVPMNTRVEHLAASAITNGGTYIITGGLGKLGITIAEHLARTRQCNLVLVSRSEATSDQTEALGKINRLLHEHSEEKSAVHMRSDIADGDSVKHLFEQTASIFGMINGVIHAAGQATVTPVLELELDEFRDGLKAKVDGLIHLEALSRQYSLELIVNFSSVSVHLGDMGSGNYAAGNRFMDEFANNHDQSQTRMISINWPLWLSGGLQIPDDEIAAMHFSGMAPMPESVGIEAFDEALLLPESQLFVIYGDAKRTEMKFAVSRIDITENEKNTVVLPQSVLHTKSEIEHFEVVKEVDPAMDSLGVVMLWVKECISSITRQDVSRINNTDSFESLGMDSVLLMECQNTIAEQVSGLPKTILFEQDSVQKLSFYLMQNKLDELNRILVLHEASSNHEGKSKTAVESNRPAVRTEIKRDRSDASNGKSRDTVSGQGVVSIHNLFSKDSAQFNKSSSLDVKPSSSGANEGVAVIGMSGRFPEANNLSEFWDNLTTGKNCIRALPEKRWFGNDLKSARYAKSLSKIYGGFLTNVDDFDHEFFGLSRLDAGKMDPQLRILLETVWHALEDAAYTKESFSNSEVGVFIGAMNNDHTHVSENLSMEHNTYVGPGAVDSELANRVSFVLDVYGPSVTVKTACSSSMTALHLACNAIKAGDCNVAIVAGVNLSLHPHKYQMLQDMKVLSTSDKEKTFDIDADGLIPSEGVGAIILKPQSDAVEAADNIHAIIKATRISHSGVGAGQYIPNINVLEKTMQSCLDKTGMSAQNLNYVESHGTATSLGDPIEIRAIEKFANSNNISELQIGTKASLGHMEAASTMCSIIKVILSIKNKTIVPCANLNQVSDAIDVGNTPLVLNKSAVPWKENSDGSRVAGINSFGMGGSNGFAIFESYVDRSESQQREVEIPIIVFSAETPEQVHTLVRDNLSNFRTMDKDAGSARLNLSSIAFTSQCGRRAYKQRIAFIASDIEQLISLMSSFLVDSNVESADIVRGTEALEPESEIVNLLNRMGNQEICLKLQGTGQWCELARLWVSGVDINWKMLYTDSQPARISLANYPFKQVDCGIHTVLEQIKSIETKKIRSRRTTNQPSTVTEFVSNAHWFIPKLQNVIEKLKVHDSTTPEEGLFEHYWKSQLPPQETLLCNFLGKTAEDINSRENELYTRNLSGSEVIALKNLSHQNEIQLGTIAAAAWAIVINRNTKVKTPSFGLGLFDALGDIQSSPLILPCPVKTIVRLKCLPWIKELQSQMEQRLHYSQVDGAPADLESVFDMSAIDTVDSALVVCTGQPDISMALERYKLTIVFAYNNDSINLSAQCSDLSVSTDEVHRMLEEFIFVLTSLHSYVDKLPGAISIAANNGQVLNVMNRLEGM